MKSAQFIRCFLAVVVGLNLVTLWVVFAGPRWEYMRSHAGWTPRQLRASSGTLDLPNLFAEPYRLAYRIRDATPSNAVVLLPPGDRAETYPPPVLQILYPRTVLFGMVPEKQAGRWRGPVYVLSLSDWLPGICHGKSYQVLHPKGMTLCRWSEP